MNATLLSAPLPDPSPARRRLREIVDHARSGYLERWNAAVAGSSRPGPERFSRTVAAHPLDLGYSASHLLAWAQGLYAERADTVLIVESAAALARSSPRSFDVLIALHSVPQRDLAEPLANWMPKGKVIAWLREHGHDTAGIRSGGGFLYQFIALDAYGAAEQAHQMIERMVARSSFLRRALSGLPSPAPGPPSRHSSPTRTTLRKLSVPARRSPPTVLR